jgi:hypothetical protein
MFVTKEVNEMFNRVDLEMVTWINTILGTVN